MLLLHNSNWHPNTQGDDVLTDWLLVGPVENWRVGIEKGIWGYRNVSTFRRLASRMNDRDRLFFYVKAPVKGLIGYGNLQGRVFTGDSPLWPDEIKEGKVIYIHRFKIEVIQVGPENAWTTDAIRLGTLDLPRGWGGWLRKAVCVISPSVSARFLDAISKWGKGEQYKPAAIVATSPPRTEPRSLDSSLESYYILQTGSDKYDDQPESRYNFKEGIPGSVLLRDGANHAKFVYYQNKEFYAKGEIGNMSSKVRNGSTYYDAEIKNYQKIGPVKIDDIREKLGIEFVGQAGIRNITKAQYETIVAASPLPIKSDPLPLDSLLKETMLETSFFDTIMRLLEGKKQVIFYGPPGTGKTFVAKRFAAHYASHLENVQLIQFHPSYSYEDFVEGIRPKTSGTQLTYPVEDGIMKSFSAEAAKYPTEKFVLIIDEINRGNLAKIFGELIHCLEYRGKDGSVSLPYSKDTFNIPENVYIIGTMNSADRSIALVDFALRRRFNFVEFFPQLDLLKKWLDERPGELASDKTVALLKAINTKITEDDKLGEYYQIGHSYFMRNELNKAKLSDIWNHGILPLLKEYYFEEKDELENFRKIYAETIGS